MTGQNGSTDISHPVSKRGLSCLVENVCVCLCGLCASARNPSPKSCAQRRRGRREASKKGFLQSWTVPLSKPLFVESAMGFGDVPAGAEFADQLPTVLTSEEKTWGMLCHLSTLLAYAAGGLTFIGPLVCWLIKKDTSKFVDYHGKESLNFQLN